MSVATVEPRLAVGLRSSAELRLAAREKLRGHWTNALLTHLVAGVVLGLLGSVRGLGGLLWLLAAGPIMLGLVGYFVMLQRGGHPAIEDLFEGFRQFGPAVVLNLLTTVFVFLWSLLLIVPGVIASLRYSMAFYLLHDQPNLPATEALNISKRWMVGHCGRLFLLYLSFLGWVLLSCLTAGLGFLWLAPYAQATLAEFYADLKTANEPVAGPPTTF